MIALLAAACLTTPAESSLVPALAELPGAGEWPCVQVGAAEDPTVVGVLSPTGLWLRALKRGPAEAARMHQINSAVPFSPMNGCPAGGGMAVTCFVTRSEPLAPMLVQVAPEQLWVAWIRRETMDVHGMGEHDRSHGPDTLMRTEVKDQILATSITMTGRQWLQGEGYFRQFEDTLPEPLTPTLRVDGGLAWVRLGEKEWPIATRYHAWNIGAMPERSALPQPPPPPPPPPPRECRGDHRMDCGQGCVDVRTHRRHCGGCGNDCGGHPCEGGVCGPFCYTDAQCRGKFEGVPQGRCKTPLVQLRGTPHPPPPCSAKSCGRWARCDDGACRPLQCETRADCPKGRVRCLSVGQDKLCVPRGYCVANFLVPKRPTRRE